MVAINTKTEHKSDRDILNSILTDVTALRTAFNTLVTKLNADAWVTDTDYAAAAALTTTETES